MVPSISVLDQSPVRKGGSPQNAINETLLLAQHCDRLGFHRYWVAEHHNSPALAGSTPEILIGRIAGSPATVKQSLDELLEVYGAEEAVVVTITHDFQARLRSYELLAEVYNLQTRA